MFEISNILMFHNIVTLMIQNLWKTIVSVLPGCERFGVYTITSTDLAGVHRD